MLSDDMVQYVNMQGNIPSGGAGSCVATATYFIRISDQFSITGC